MNARLLANNEDSLTAEYSSAPKVQLLHLEHELSTSRSRILPRECTDGRAPTGSIVGVKSMNQDPLLQEAIASREAVVFVNRTGTVIAGTLDGLIERLINNMGKLPIFNDAGKPL